MCAVHKLNVANCIKLSDRIYLQSNIASLHLDYGLIRMPTASSRYIEVESAGEISANGLGGTPFQPDVMQFRQSIDNNKTNMLYALVSDFVPNSLLYHGHR